MPDIFEICSDAQDEAFFAFAVPHRRGKELALEFHMYVLTVASLVSKIHFSLIICICALSFQFRLVFLHAFFKFINRYLHVFVSLVIFSEVILETVHED